MPSKSALILDAFRPTEAIDDPSLFAGRRAQVREMCQALHTPGACPVLLGDRGIGKTSLALQLQHIAQGDTVLLETLGLADEWQVAEADSYIPFTLQCTDSVRNQRDLLQRIVNVLTSTVIEVDPRRTALRLRESTTHLSIDLKVVAAARTRTSIPASDTSILQKLDLEEQVIRSATNLTRATGRGVILILDELDRVNTKGLASYIRAASSPTLRFVLVGVANTLTDLLHDHQSLERIIHAIHVQPMSEAELIQICELAITRLHGSGFRLQMDFGAVKRIAQMAGGFPWFAHVIGQDACLLAAEQNASTVTVEHVAAAVRHLGANTFAQRYSDIYQNAVRDSVRREVVLRVFAFWGDRDIPTADCYRVARTLGVTNPSVYLGHLLNATYGQILLRPQIQRQGLVRFRDEMFKKYCSLRPSLYEGVDDQVAVAWRKRRDSANG